ncbi:Asp23/Gls24 family envelope stress response protein [Arthrobacter sp. D1-29]
MEYQNPQPDAGVRNHVAASPTQAPVPGHGRTVISETAVAKVAGIAARAVPGVYSLGSGSSRALGAIRDAVGSSDHAAGVHAEVGETQVAVDINLVATYGTPLHSLADQVRSAVYRAVEELVGLQVIEVNVEITDVYVAPPVKSPAGTGTAGAVGTTEREALL